MVEHKGLCQCNDASLEHVFRSLVLSRLFDYFAWLNLHIDFIPGPGFYFGHDRIKRKEKVSRSRLRMISLISGFSKNLYIRYWEISTDRQLGRYC